MSSQATKEAEIRKTVVPGQPQKKKLGVVAHAYHSWYFRKHK
jgi:hypothetical protein